MKCSCILFVLASAVAIASGAVVPDILFDSRVVGGEDAPVGIAPYQVSLRTGYYNSHFCGGSILNRLWVVTAAHCLVSQSASAISVVTGTNSLSSGGDFYYGDTIVVHPAYDSRVIKNDVGLLKVESLIEFNKLVQPIALTSSTLKSGTDLVLTGWGRIAYPGSLPDRLQILSVLSVEVSECKKLLRSINPVFDNQVCAFSKRGQGACHGDSGGPLMARGELVGVVSWGVPCAEGYPDVYTSMYAFRDWILSSSSEEDLTDSFDLEQLMYSI